jgi:uncharacterized protein YndB with AHSA1/START domain
VNVVSASVDVDVDPATAFEVFTAEIDAWFRIDRFTVPDFTRTVAIRFEPGVGGRLLDVHDERSGAGREVGRITAWEPGSRLVFTDNRATEVEVTFAPIGTGTGVTVEHRGLDRLPPDEAARVARRGWLMLLNWYRDHLRR